MPSLKSSIGNHQNISLDDVCNLLTITTTKDDLNQFIRSEKSTLIFCSRLSITRSEFNSSGMLGHKPNMMLIVDSDSYDQEKLVEYQKITYNIYKSFQRQDGFTELYCEVKQGD
jgi:hypothetical protein